MPRTRREKSETGIYHIMLRGIDGRKIFLDSEDNEMFLNYVKRAKKIGGFKLYAYCLMNNHAHMLVKEGEEIGRSIKRITVGYVQCHNNKYGRTGHLFQNRYKSEPINDESYFVAAVRYIHQNPVKAKLVRNIKDYKWSSYKEYISKYDGQETYIDTEVVMNYFTTKNDFEYYMNQSNDDKFLEYKSKKKYTDEELKAIINSFINIDNIDKLSKKERDEVILTIYQKTDLSIRQLSKSIGIGRGIIEKAVKKR